MPVTFVIHTAHKVLLCEASGTFTYDDVRSFRGDLVNDPGFAPDLSVLFDLRDVTDFEMSSAEIQELAIQSPMGSGAKRAFVTREGFDFGLMRIFVGYSNADPDRLGVFHDLGEAREWLGLDNGPRAERESLP